MSTERNKESVRHYFEGFNTGNTDSAGEFIADGFTHHLPGGAPIPKGPQGYRQAVATVRAGLPNVRYTLETMIVEGDWIAARYVGSGTHRGSYMGVPPTGKEVSVTGMALFHVAGGKIDGIRLEENLLQQMQQLGAVPSPSEQPRRQPARGGPASRLSGSRGMGIASRTLDTEQGRNPGGSGDEALRGHGR